MFARVCRGKNYEPLSATPLVRSQHAQRRWDTSPYRNAHKLIWTRLNKARDPWGGSSAWRPSWGHERPLPSESFVPQDACHRERPELLCDLLNTELGIPRVDALSLVHRGRVAVGGRIQNANRWVEPREIVTINGHSLTNLASLAMVAHKPPRCTLTEQDPLKRNTFRSLLPDPTVVVQARSLLDFPSSGVLLLTNDKRMLAAAKETCTLSATFEVRLRERIGHHEFELLQFDEAYGDDVRCEDVDLQPSRLGEAGGASFLRITLRGGGVPAIRHALEVVGIRPSQPIACKSVGSLNIEESALNRPGSIRRLTESEVLAFVESVRATSSEQER